jgi:hypothetical protein
LHPRPPGGGGGWTPRRGWGANPPRSRGVPKGAAAATPLRIANAPFYKKQKFKNIIYKLKMVVPRHCLASTIQCAERHLARMREDFVFAGKVEGGHGKT